MEDETSDSLLLRDRWRYELETNSSTYTRGTFEIRSKYPPHSITKVESFLGKEDRRFLGGKSFYSKLPAAQSSGGPFHLHRAVEMGVYDVLEAAFAPDALPKVNVNMMTCFGETLLHTAVLNERQAIVQLLLAHGADMNIEIPRMSFEKEQLHIEGSAIIRSENFRFSRIVHAHEATPVHYACLVGNLEILKTLIGWKGPNTFTLRMKGSLLLWAVNGGHVHIVNYLLKRNIETNCFDEDGNNSIGIACMMLEEEKEAENLRQIIKLLNLANIEMNHKNFYGLTPLDVTEKPHIKEMLEHLGGETGKCRDMTRLLSWDRERSRQEFTYCTDRRAIKLRSPCS